MEAGRLGEMASQEGPGPGESRRKLSTIMTLITPQRADRDIS